MRKCLYTLVLILSGLTSQLYAEVSVSGRHVYVLYSAVDSVVGSYLFLVSNNSSEPSDASFPVMLPKETVDFEAVSGLSPDELKLGADGGLMVEKSFRPGDSLITVGFKVPGNLGQSDFTLKPELDIKSLSFFVKPGTIQISGKAGGYQTTKEVSFGGKKYDTYTKENVKSGLVESISVGNLPRGRGQYWILGSAVTALLILISGLLAYRSRPV